MQLDASGHASITPADIDNGSNDACGVTLSIDKSEFTGADIGENTVTLTATDSNGNSGTETATVTIEGYSANNLITVDSDGNCTLHDAITAANTDTATGGCPAGSGHDTIILETDVLLAAALPEITSLITIEGQGHTIDGNNDPNVGGVLRNGVDGNLTLNEVTVTKGKSIAGGGINNEGELALINSAVKNNSVSCLDSATYALGGGIYNTGTLTLTGSAVDGNTISCSDGYGAGGGIFNTGIGALTLTNTTVNSNSVTGLSTGDYTRLTFGGGIANGGDNATATLNDSTVSGNSVLNSGEDGVVFGGGIANGWPANGTLTLNASIVNGNAVLTKKGYAAAGGIANFGDNGTIVLTLNNSTVSGNSTLPDPSWSEGELFGSISSAGGIANWGSEQGGPMTIINGSTISDNYTKNYGGGLENLGGAIVLRSSIVSGNSATESDLSHEIYNTDYYDSTITADSFNLFGQSGKSNAQAFKGFTPGSSDITATSDGTNPTALSDILSPLADNGGPTMTHALVPGSPALDLDTTCSTGLTTDQRGEPRPVGDGCDAGAFEGSISTGKNTSFLPAIYLLLLNN